MNRKMAQNALAAGVVFSVIILFLVLIDFTTTGALLVARILGRPTGLGQAVPLVFFIIFMGLLGLWNGSLAARPVDREDTFKNAVIASLIAGG
jgi:hypothetical protein